MGAMHAECAEPKLYKFMRRPKDLSPARVNAMMGYKKPFDRHDWVVDRCGQHVRYIIDFYEGNVNHAKDSRQGSTWTRGPHWTPRGLADV